MATWHQDRNPVPLWHKTQFTVVEDSPGGSTCVSRWPTYEAAEEHRRKLARPGRMAYILYPENLRGQKQ